MLRHTKQWSEAWKKLPWKKFRKTLFRLQIRVYKAMRANDRKKALKLQRLILRSASARFLAIRQITQLNAGKKTSGIDGLKSLNFKQRFELEETLKRQWSKWEHKKLKEIPIPKKDGTKRILKVPTLADRSWQKLIHYALEPAHEASFHAKSYGFRTGRSAHDAQKVIFQNLSSRANGIKKTILELDIEKCFDRIDHCALMDKVILPQNIKVGIWKCLKIGIDPKYPEQGTPQGGPLSPTLANIALHGIETLGNIIRYADDLVAILKPSENAQELLTQIKGFLAQLGLNVKSAKTRVVSPIEGFVFLGWHFQVQSNEKFKCVPSEENYKTFRQKVKTIVNCSNYGAKTKSKKLARLVRGWRNYHRFCKMEGSKYSLWSLNNRAWKVFNKETKLNRYQVSELIKKAFPSVPNAENRHINVKGDRSPYDGDLKYWAERNSKLYDGATVKTLKKQQYRCGVCGLRFDTVERVHLHHNDGNHDNWRQSNLIAVHESCHDYLHQAQP